MTEHVVSRIELCKEYAKIYYLRYFYILSSHGKVEVQFQDGRGKQKEWF